MNSFIKNLSCFNFFWDKKNILQVPIFWEDDVCLEIPNYKFTDYTFLKVNGLKVYNFHPHLIYLNSNNKKTNDNIKKRYSKYTEIKKTQIEHQINKLDGIGKFFDYLVKNISKNESHFMKDLL